MHMFTALPCHTALFLDFDGTLVALAERPDAVQVAPEVRELLMELQSLLGGALALVSGRQLHVLDHLLMPIRLPAAGGHGLQRRDVHGRTGTKRQVRINAQVQHACRALSEKYPVLLVEDKYAAIAVHYRQAPELEAVCRHTLCQALQDFPFLELVQGKAVFEVKPKYVNKGTAIADFLAEAPFAGRVPVFVGDDYTDEQGFAVVQAEGGITVKVGPGPTCAAFRLNSSQEVICWLQAFRDQLTSSSKMTEARA